MKIGVKELFEELQGDPDLFRGTIGSREVTKENMSSFLGAAEVLIDDTLVRLISTGKEEIAESDSSMGESFSSDSEAHNEILQ